MKVELTIQASEIEKELDWTQSHNGIYLKSEVIDEIEKFVIVEQEWIAEDCESFHRESDQYLIAITKSGKKLRLFQIGINSSDPEAFPPLPGESDDNP